jgi:hypothetical protein
MHRVHGRSKSNEFRIRLEGENCVYCGEYASQQDHFPPKASTVFGFILPSCRECNNLAATSYPFDFIARAAHVKTRLRDRYARWLECPDWADEEIETLGRGLIQGVMAWRAQKKIIRERLAWNAERYLNRIDQANDFVAFHAKIESMRGNGKGWSTLESELD